ncbi:MAG: FG-GAP repeat domain-containing protein [Bacteriovoracaceae bacterium]
MKFKKFLLIIFITLMIFGGVYILTQGQRFPNSYVIHEKTHLLEENEKKNYSGAISVNLDNDQDSEIFVSALESKNVFFKWSNGKFEKLFIPNLEEENGKTFSVSACDITSDGRDEILLINRDSESSRVVTYKNGEWVDLLLDQEIRKSLSNAYASACIDRKGDHRYGFVVTVENGEPLYLEISNSKVLNIAQSIGLNKVASGRSVIGVPGPSGKTNIFFGNSHGSNFYYKNQNDGTFKESAESLGISDPDFEARGVSLIDLNHDEMMDLIYGNHFGPLRMLEQSADGHFKDVTPENLVTSYAVNSAVVADFNLDGFEDIYLNNIRHANNLIARYENKWFQISLENFDEKDFYGISSLTGDFNNDGKVDLLNTHGDGDKFPLTLYTFDPVGEGVSFKIQLRNGGLPRGAQLKLRTTMRDRMKAIYSGSGRFANYDDVLIFGLVKNEKVVSAEVILTTGQKVIKNQQISLNKINIITVDGTPY